VELTFYLACQFHPISDLDDVQAIHSLIVELAIYEREPDAVKTTPEQLIQDGFGENPVFHVFVVEHANVNGQKSVVGMALYFFQYSTWEGKVLFLEDLYITPECRGHGMGKKLLVTLAQEAQKQNCKRFQWQVLFWNEPSIEFYKSTGAKEMSDWRIYRMNAGEIDTFVAANAAS
jgi:GNAT superfamily N-acetyltransferase